jgi:hypothetical protein
MRRPCLIPVLACIILAGGCASPRPPERAPFSDLDPLPLTDHDRRAERAVSEVEAAAAATRTLPPREALARQEALGPRIADAVELAQGTRYANRALFLQAQWCFNFHDDGAGVLQALDALDKQEKPTLKNSGNALRVQYLLRQEQRGEARALAEQVATAVPEFGFLLGMTAWHERIGGTVSGTAGMTIDGHQVEPTTGPERWLLYLHLATWNDFSAFTVARYLEAIAAAGPTVQGDCRLVVIVRDGSLTRLKADVAQLPNRAAATIIYCRTSAEAQAVVNAWHPPLDGWTVLLDRDRRIARVEVRPGDLAPLVQ